MKPSAEDQRFGIGGIGQGVYPLAIAKRGCVPHSNAVTSSSMKMQGLAKVSTEKKRATRSSRYQY